MAYKVLCCLVLSESTTNEIVKRIYLASGAVDRQMRTLENVALL